MKMNHRDFAFELKSVDEAGIIEGYASTFGGAPDLYGDVIAPGAYAPSLAKHRREGTFPLMLWGHDASQPPIGNWLEMAEDGKGLRVKGQLDLEDQLAARVYRALGRKAMKGLSIGYETKQFETDPKRPGVRLLTEIDLWEVSPVNFPAQNRAAVDTVKSHFAGGGLPNKREFEESLRELGLSKSQALIVIAKGFGELLRSESGADQRAEFFTALRG